MPSNFASESGHWYQPDGTPAYTTQAKNGSERATTLRDARKLGLYPSTTGIIQMAARPGLERWKRTQTLLAALTLPRHPGEPEADWLARVEQDAGEQAAKAAERGTQIHGWLEAHFRGESVPITDESFSYIHGTSEAIFSNAGAQQWKAEKSYAHPSGYGCKIDLHSDQWVIDYKTKEFTAEEAGKLETYFEHEMQLAANRRAARLPTARCAIVFVSASVPGLAVFREVDETDLARGLVCFDHLYGYWRALNRYDPTLLTSGSMVGVS